MGYLFLDSYSNIVYCSLKGNVGYYLDKGVYKQCLENCKYCLDSTNCKECEKG